MANRTDPEAASVHGTNPQTLVEKIVRSKIYNSTFWKESCFALNAESLVDRGAELKAVGGTYGGARQPSDFLCLILKMLQIQPDREVVLEYILQEDYKYLRVLGAFYLRLVGKPDEVYRYIEPLFNDSRKARIRNADGNFALTHMDALAEDMLYKDYMFDISLPRLPKRATLEKEQLLGPRISGLDDHDIATLEAEAEKEAALAEELIKQQNAVQAAQAAAPPPDGAVRAARDANGGEAAAPPRRRPDERAEDSAAAADGERDRAPHRRDSERDRERDDERARERDRDSGRDRRYRDGRDGDRDRGEHDKVRGRPRGYEDDRPRERERGYDEYRPRERERGYDRDRDRERERSRRDGGDKDRDRARERERDRDRDRDGAHRHDRGRARDDDVGGGRDDDRRGARDRDDVRDSKRSKRDES